jgi:uncharacterized protein (DUF433 family)
VGFQRKERAMPETRDILDQFLDLPPDRREMLAARFFEAFPFAPHSNGARPPEFPSVVSTPNVCGGSPRLVRTRIPVWVLQRMRQLGFSDAKVLECYPTLTAGDLVQAWGYAAQHKAEIEKEIEENERE